MGPILCPVDSSRSILEVTLRRREMERESSNVRAAEACREAAAPSMGAVQSNFSLPPRRGLQFRSPLYNFCQAMLSAKAVYFWACFGLSVLVARAARPPPVPQCDGVNCFVILPHTSGANEWSAEHSTPPAPAKLLKLQLDSNIAPVSADCKPPAKLNASSCPQQGLPCASMGRSFFFSPANQYNLAGPASCSGSFITDDTVLTAGHCCMPLAGAWVSDVFFYTDYNNGQFSGAYAPIEMTVSEHWKFRTTSPTEDTTGVS